MAQQLIYLGYWNIERKLSIVVPIPQFNPFLCKYQVLIIQDWKYFFAEEDIHILHIILYRRVFVPFLFQEAREEGIAQGQQASYSHQGRWPRFGRPSVPQ
jgi:hypothetical protein